VNSSDNQKPQRPAYPIGPGDITRVILATLLILIAGFTVVALLTMTGILTGGEPPTPEHLENWTKNGISSLPLGLKLMAMVVQVALIIPVLLFLRNHKLSYFVFLRVRPVPISLLFYSVIVGFAIAVIGDEINRLIGLVLPMPEELFEGLAQAMTLKTTSDVLTLGITVAVLAPVVEEMIFRGFFQRYFEATRGVTSGVLVASALFAVYHFNLYWLIPILLMSTVMGAMVWRAESVFPSITVHATNNVIGLVTANLWGTTDPSWYAFKGQVSPWMILLALVLLVVSLRQYFSIAQAKGLGGHSPRGDTGGHLDTRA
jgi:membrane protease YdiL (CAAX protease family)